MLVNPVSVCEGVRRREPIAASGPAERERSVQFVHSRVTEDVRELRRNRRDGGTL
jgi:hypothetical protein